MTKLHWELDNTCALFIKKCDPSKVVHDSKLTYLAKRPYCSGDYAMQYPAAVLNNF